MANITVVRVAGGRKIIDTTFDPALIPTSDQKAAMDIKPTMSALDAVALQSDIAAITAGTTINPSTGTISSWKNATGIVFNSASSITINRSDIEEQAFKGVPVRYSSDGVTWKYGLIENRVTNPSTLDLTIVGVAMTAPTVAFFQVGSANQVVARQITITGDLAVGDDQIDSVLNEEFLWPYSEAFLVYAAPKVKTAAAGADLLVNVAIGSAGDNFTSSDLNLAQSATRVNSGTTVNEANYKIDLFEKIFVNVDQIGSTTAGSNLSLILLFVVNTFQVEQFIPQAAPVPPFAFQMGGCTSASSMLGTVPTIINSIEYFAMSVATGGGADRGDDLLARNHACAVFDGTRTFNCGGFDGSANSNVMAFIDTPSISVDAVDRGDLISAVRELVGVSGETHGFTMGGQIGVGQTNDIYTILLPTATGDASNRDDLPAARRGGSGGYNNEKGLHCSGVTSFFFSDIYSLNLATTVGGAIDRGDTVVAAAYMTSISDQDNDEVYLCGGTTNTSSLSSGQLNNITTIDLVTATGDAVDRDDLSRITGGAAGNSADTIGYISGGGTSSPGAVVGAIDKFNYTTGTISVSNRGSMLVPKHTTGGDM